VLPPKFLRYLKEEETVYFWRENDRLMIGTGEVILDTYAGDFEPEKRWCEGSLPRDCFEEAVKNAEPATDMLRVHPWYTDLFLLTGESKHVAVFYKFLRLFPKTTSYEVSIVRDRPVALARYVGSVALIVGVRLPGEAFQGAVRLLQRFAETVSLERELEEENRRLWAIFKTCPGCKNLVAGDLSGCYHQDYLDGENPCNWFEREE